MTIASESSAEIAPQRHLIAALYKFAALPDAPRLVETYRAEAAVRDLRGVLLIAPEGINGTISGAPERLRDFLALLRRDPRLADLSWKESWAEAAPTRRLRVRLKREIVSMGAPDIVSPATVGTYVAPRDWNALITTPGVAVIDVRNDYETAIGGFKGAIDPGTERFRDFPSWAEAAPALRGAEAVAMYCTGGIRCEKASAYLRALGHARVYHLEGGVLRYLETEPAETSLWRGQCFVFDERVSVGHGLAPGGLSLCRGCRRPLTAEDRRHPAFVDGVACAACAPATTEAQREGRAERMRQMALAQTRGAHHLATGPAQRRS
ncbi:MAG: rhodanese-related sulfurtransferase [Pseudomonadota bacterium]